LSGLQVEYVAVSRLAVMEIAKKTRWLRPPLINRREGFTFIEILVSIGLIATGILGLSLNTIGVIKGNYISSNYTTATSLAQDKMEELLGQSTFSDVTNSPDPNNPITATGASGGIFTRIWTISDPSLGTGLKQVTVTVSWTAYLIGGRNVTLKTFVFAG